MSELVVRTRWPDAVIRRELDGPYPWYSVWSLPSGGGLLGQGNTPEGAWVAAAQTVLMRLRA